ncbi:P-loop containing nucleoside triphosphate hydrolase protein [Stachybotrys elegans]|uniref:P-loop containing nucleoside triphosphate hydrolase protein n=1 Tax=Stachybotrys elegans TaxID=80388 RepID=A0A8K0WTC9_9HYPO|nr:P-loop containing nucleoside triphosphate hydrolase protein [Stachybotrys elegans]
MFTWYQRSNKCYVLLTDVSIHFENNDLNHRDPQLRQSWWFSRGWTLQELLAPVSVELFSREGKPLGSKRLLEKQIAEITGIPVSALRGTPLSFFTTEEKLSWMKNRQTRREEDSVYSLLGIFDLHMPAMYGEGRQHALQRLQSEIEKQLNGSTSYKRSDSQHAINRWIVPFERNSRFTDREGELTQLEQKFFSPDRFTKVAICGLGGVGKTQLVLELLYREKERNSNCCAIWIQATSTDSLDQGFHAAARQLGIPNIDNKDADVKQLVRDFLSEDATDQWILVFDNADDIQMWCQPMASDNQESTRLLDYIPRSKTGRVIFTTRDRKVGVRLAQDNVVELLKLNEDSSLRMLRGCLVDKSIIDNNIAAAKSMLTWLTHLPLAISQAASYINENSISLEEYLSLVDCQEQDIIDLLTEHFEDDARYSDVKNPVATTWLISFQQLQQQDPLAADYMSFMACIDHKDVPQHLLPPGPSRKQEMDAIGRLKAYSFITRRTREMAIDIHRLVHLAVRSWLRNKGVLSEWTHRAMERLEEVFPDHEHRNRAIWRTYLPHARCLLDSSLLPQDHDSRMSLEWKIALCYYSDGRFGEAEQLIQRVMLFRTNTLGEEHPDTLRCLAKLSLIYHAQSRFLEAEKLGSKAMAGQVIVLGEEDPETMSTMSNLAMTYSDLSKWKEAEELELQTMKLRRRVLGVEHPDTLVGMSNLVYLYNCQGWWAKAEEIGKETITARKKVLGVEHPDTLLSIGNLAHTYNNQGRYREAEELLTSVMNIRIRVLGRDHPHTLSGMSNLGVSYHNQGRWEEAEAMQSQVVASRKELLGPEHFSTLTSMAHLSLTYQSQGRRDEAEQLALEVMELRKKVLGPEHHHTLNSMTSLASMYADSQPAKAEELFLQALAIRMSVLGMEHHHTIGSMSQLSALYRKLGRIKEAEELEGQITEIREKLST